MTRLIPPALSRRRGRTRRRGTGIALRRPFRRRRPRTRSWSSSVSFGTSGRGGDDRSSPERSSGRRPEFGIARAWGCSSRSSERRAQAVATRQQEHIELSTRGGGARGHGARRPWRTAASGARGAAATGHAREREVRGKEERLTADSQSSSMGSGKLLRRRIDGGDLRWPTRGTAVLATSRGFWRRTAR